MPLVLRPAVNDDAGFAAVCVAAAYAQWIPRLGRKPGPMLDDYHAIIAEDRVLIAEQNGAAVGLLVMRETDEGFLLDNIAVLPECTGQGIGRALLVHAEETAARLGFDSLYLYTNEQMTENIELYEKNGYHAYARKVENGFRRVYMRKQLG